jgi:hypothetical protein
MSAPSTHTTFRALRNDDGRRIIEISQADVERVAKDLHVELAEQLTGTESPAATHYQQVIGGAALLIRQALEIKALEEKQ